MTKASAGLFFLPGLFIFSIYKKKFIEIIKNKHLYFGIVFFLFVVLGYYLLREHYNPGYLKAAWINDYAGRYLGAEVHTRHDFWYYIDNFLKIQLQQWRLWLPCALFIGLFYSDLIKKQFSTYILFLFVPFFIIISFSKVKMTWYDLPLYPLFAISLGLLLYYGLVFIAKKTNNNNILKTNIVPYIILFLILINPYHEVIKKTYKPKEHPWFVEGTRLQYILRDAASGKTDVNGYTVIKDWYEAQNLFYMNVLNDKGIKIKFNYVRNLMPGDKVILDTKIVMDSTLAYFNVDTIRYFNNVYFLKINGTRPFSAKSVQ